MKASSVRAIARSRAVVALEEAAVVVISLFSLSLFFEEMSDEFYFDEKKTKKN